jgi:hypothetical protein
MTPNQNIVVNGYSTTLISMLETARLHQKIMLYNNKIENYVILDQKKGSQLLIAFFQSNRVLRKLEIF